MKCTIYYGMSGSLKLSTMNSLHKYDFKVYSDTKPFYDLDRDYFNWSSRPNDAHLAIHRLLMLNSEGYLPHNGVEIAIERGISDNLFCIPNRSIPGMELYENVKIDKLVNLEIEYIKSRTKGYKIKKKLLIMEDKDFIINKVLIEDHRKSIYPNLDIYLTKQNEYVEFTKKWNKIDETIIINDARTYIEDSLKLKYD